MNKEVLIRSLKKHIEKLDEIKEDIESIKRQLQGLVDELEDESKIGIPAEYDFGEREYSRITKEILKILKKDTKAIEEFSEYIVSLQEDFSKKVTPDEEKFSEE
ncbi:MAG: hypothetical protein DRI36_05980 [Caldiserica bacterium]|nr:MAG: hypothetical protein DRI36_05980 [Caldisericota bacterium]